jgi:hypothetical protein
MYQLKLSLPNLSKGAKVGISGLGEFENGKTHTISSEQAERFRHANAEVVDAGEPSEDGRRPVRLELGPPITEVFKAHEHISVTQQKPTPEGSDNK